MSPLNINEYQRPLPAVGTGGDDAKLKEQTDAFEAIIVKMLLDEAIRAEDPLLPKDPAREIYRSMQNDQMSRELTGAFGYSELLYRFLTDKKVSERS
ncbi:Rod binding protein [Hydrogenimonas sp.]